MLRTSLGADFAMLRRVLGVAALLCASHVVINGDALGDDWVEIYEQDFNSVAAGTESGQPGLEGWERHSACGKVFAGRTKEAGHFLVAAYQWTSFNQGPILNLDLHDQPHDRVRIEFDLYALGDWRGLQRPTGGPLHRLMFFDNQANPGFAFDTNFATNPGFKQSWPEKNPATHPAGRGAEKVVVDSTGRFPQAWKFPVRFEYPSDSPALRFAILCGAASGSGNPMPPFGIDNVRVAVRSTIPTINLKERVAASPGNKQQVGVVVPFSAPDAERHSVGIFDAASGRLVRTLLAGASQQFAEQPLAWDGRDDQGRLQPAGTYQWRSLSSDGLKARYLTTIGINPPGGEHPVPSFSWVGDHLGAGTVDVDDSGVYVGSMATEGGRMILKCDSKMQSIQWRRPQFYEGGRLHKVAASGQYVFMLHPTGKLRRLDPGNGSVQATWQVEVDGSKPVGMDAQDQDLCLIYPDKQLLVWRDPIAGSELARQSCPGVTCVSVAGSSAKQTAFLGCQRKLMVATGGDKLTTLQRFDGVITCLDFDLARDQLWVVVDGWQIYRLTLRRQQNSWQLAQQDRIGSSTSQRQPRQHGLYQADHFQGISDIASDGQGGFYVTEPSVAARRLAWFDATGTLKQQWFGGMSFYINGCFDPGDPTRLYGIAAEGSVNVYKVDYDSATWQIVETYQVGNLGDSLFPYTGAFTPVRRDGELYLYHRVVPSVLWVDRQNHRVVPVAIAGRVLNRGRTMFQFAGSGEDGYPKPWAAAARHHGYSDLASTPKLYSWADTNGNGWFEPEEFRFYKDAQQQVSFHNGGDYRSTGNYVSANGVNKPGVYMELPVAQWEGPKNNAPRWDWNQIRAVGELQADGQGYASPRGISVASDDSVSVAFQAGIMIRDHGQYEGGGWPEMGVRGSRVLKYDNQNRPRFAVGRQSKDASEVNSGALYYPMQTTHGPQGSVIVNDQTKQPAQVWSADGLYVGGFFDHREDDGLDDRFYQVHGDDNQGASVVTTDDGATYWLMPYQGHNRLYQISGWDRWQRRQGTIELDVSTLATLKQSTIDDNQAGLKATYQAKGKTILETVEAPIFYERFGAPAHAGKLPENYQVTWTGTVTPVISDRYGFQSLLGKSEQVAVWIDGTLVHANGTETAVNERVALSAGHEHQIRIQYINPAGRAELKLFWNATAVDHGRIPNELLRP